MRREAWGAMARLRRMQQQSGRERSLLQGHSHLAAFGRSSLSKASVPNHAHYSSSTASTTEEEVVIAIGSNIGDRIANFNRALELMRASGIQAIRHASLYESAPAYVTDQPLFLNSAVSAITSLDPHSLLRTLKDIESELGRTSGGIRYGPRPLDLDIIFYGNRSVTTETLEIPHARFLERPFVLAPLADLLNDAGTRSTSHWSNHKRCDGGVAQAWNKMGGEACIGNEDLRRVIPVGNELLDLSAKTHVMGILNVTPDSFSDGGRFMAVEDAVAHARSMAAEGADFIDIGAQSTRPGATRLSTEEELSRLVPVLEALTADSALKGVKLSVDTFDARVGREAVKMGVHVVNDVSGGSLDSEMLSTVAELGVPYIMMHMRGDPTNMQSKANTTYSDVCEEVGKELNSRVVQAEAVGVPAWRIITDPGIGFSKTLPQNLDLLKHLPVVRRVLSESSCTVSRGPMLVGPSRKGFLGKITERQKGEDRDAATVAAAVVAAIGGANIIRAHNVRAVRDAMKVVDAIYK
ncbi:folate synthesis bifunctional protein isoform X2 [Physcomitrium patens]|uniref:Pterin-binding domain-containing protein n=1 Tax=Physcomitrium patens TaxID=3218 RepID=A0A7I4CVM6_PHYPA|nr:folate synthesis bifunctional protein-like isoform X3 [Physcomitrium patens]|eukprot:XP_024367170.1 folate synthesis bifunctional protein-like isoform X3 [Physcomitrella patens]